MCLKQSSYSLRERLVGGEQDPSVTHERGVGPVEVETLAVDVGGNRTRSAPSVHGASPFFSGTRQIHKESRTSVASRVL